MEQEQYQQIKASIRRLLNIDLTHYKDEQMRRRLDSWLIRSGAPNWEDYFKRVQADAKEMSKFRDYLTINVSEFFRDPERWRSLREKILPYLLQSSGTLKVWSAGCSTGQEPYTLAILLDEVLSGRPYSVLATDLDRGALSKAKARGPYTADEVRNLTPPQRSKYLETATAPIFIKPSLAQRITFREHNLFADPFESHLDLIVCRNVIIYFTAEAKEQLYKKFQAALRPGGVLFLGGTEIIPRPMELGFRNQDISFYIKV
jgi:chemotaxis protein methyltransferase CheR